jgi:putative DNA primase/helicase
MSNKLLADIQYVFEYKELEKISTVSLIEKLCEDEERPWATYNRGKQISPRQIAKYLAGYEIKSKTIRIGCETAKGFERSQFDDVFKRYLADPQNLPSQGNNPLEVNNDACFDVTDTKNHTVIQSTKVTQEATPNNDCDVVTDKTGCAKTTHPEPSHLRI